MSPLSSATSMKSPGGTSPTPGRRQPISASAPRTLPLSGGKYEFDYN